MSYYDSVKDNIRDKKKQEKEDSGDKMTGNFDSLKEAAQENPNEDEGDDTPIEVLEEDGISTESPSRKKQKEKQKQQKKDQRSTNPLKQNTENESAKSSNSQTDLSEVEDKLDRIIEQNDELIDILRSFAQ